MENELNLQDEIKMRLTPMAENFLMAATRWAKFLSVLGFILSGFILILALAFGTIISALGAMGGSSAVAAGVPAALGTIVYLIVSVIYFFIAYFMYNFASKTQKALTSRQEQLMEDGMKSIRNYFQIIGIMAIIGLALFVVIILVGIIAALSTL